MATAPTIKNMISLKVPQSHIKNLDPGGLSFSIPGRDLRKLSTTQRRSLRSTVQSIYKYLIWVVALLMGVVAPLIGVVVLLMGVVALLMGVSLSAVMC